MKRIVYAIEEQIADEDIRYTNHTFELEEAEDALVATVHFAFEVWNIALPDIKCRVVGYEIDVADVVPKPSTGKRRTKQIGNTSISPKAAFETWASELGWDLPEPTVCINYGEEDSANIAELSKKFGIVTYFGKTYVLADSWKECNNNPIYRFVAPIIHPKEILDHDGYRPVRHVYWKITPEPIIAADGTLTLPTPDFVSKPISLYYHYKRGLE